MKTSAMSRQMYNYSTNTTWKEGDTLPTSDYDAMSFLNASKDFYNTLKNMFGRLSYDNKGLL